MILTGIVPDGQHDALQFVICWNRLFPASHHCNIIHILAAIIMVLSYSVHHSQEDDGS